tara:strand:- start:5507 stop:6028 length:522 start_codon:yes stop_codon:yes gene_type:complete
MVRLSFQEQDCSIAVAEGVEEYRAYLQENGKKPLVDQPGSTLIRDHDITHVIFGLDTSLEQESLLDTWVLLGCTWKFKDLYAYQKLPEIKELYSYLKKEIGYIKLFLTILKLMPIKFIIRRRTKKMIKKWPFKSPDYFMSQRVCDLREEYGIKILLPEERIITEPLIWAGTIR